jgi:hypothetical protein
VSGTPLVARLKWDPMPNAQRYVVRRENGIAAALERTPLNFGGTELLDTVPDPRPTYRYTVTAFYSDGTSGESPAAQFQSPPLLNPTGFTAKDLGDGKVKFEWHAAAGATRYRVDGPGLPNTGQEVSGTTSTIVENVPAGPNSWTLVALYPGNFADYPGAAAASRVVRVLPLKSQPWLSRAGVGSPVETAMHYSQICGAYQACLSSIRGAVGSPGFRLWGPLGTDGQEAVYANTIDLGFGRRTGCGQVMKGPPVPGWLTVCYSTSHGPGPAQPGFNDPQIITRAAAGEQPAQPRMLKDPWGDMPRSATVMVQDPRGTVFLALTPGVGDWTSDDVRDNISWEEWLESPVLLPSLALDSEGPKRAPQSCMACHGGRLDAGSNRVQGASFLPLDPGVLSFGVTVPGDRTDYSRSGQEPNIRRINQMIFNAGAGSAVTKYILGLYNGALYQTSAPARDDYVPSGWSEQPGLYRSIVKPYCASCHLAAPSHVNFASWGNFLQNKAQIYSTVCVSHTMPQSEIAYRAFWTKDTGVLYLPGLLAAALGYSSCP